MDQLERARQLMREFKGDRYTFGPGALGGIGRITARAGKRATLIRETFPGSDAFVERITGALSKESVRILAQVPGARPNCPREDLFRIADALRDSSPEVVVTFGGGSTIDAAKAAEVLRSVGGDIEEYFGTGLVTKAIARTGKRLSPHVAIQTVASSGAHLTKYANITDVGTGQKKLIVDEAIVPSDPLFDYEVTYSLPRELTMDGALDGVAHCLEVLYGAVGKPFHAKAREIAEAAITLVVEYLPRAIDATGDRVARDALCLATDLGGYAIMVGGTNGGHLTSFSLVDVLSHGRACAIMNPYYTVFFAPAIQEELRLVGRIFREHGYLRRDPASLAGRELGVAVAEAMTRFGERVGFPTRLDQVPGVGAQHIERALAAAKNPQLDMKMRNMPVPLHAGLVDEFMRPILEAAWSGDFGKIRNL